jgi:hypothetical protein
VTGYTIEDLQEIDERCRTIAADDLGFDVPDVVYHLVRPEEVYFAAANGLPARYSSARWGAQFDAEYGRYQRGESRIYELIFNTSPVHAYLMEGNSLVAQTLVIAHCLGHGWVFEHNRWLGGVDRRSCRAVLAAAERIADYMGARARTASRTSSTPATRSPSTSRRRSSSGPRATPSPSTRQSRYDALFPDEVDAPIAATLRRSGGAAPRFPRSPEQDSARLHRAPTRAGSTTGSATSCRSCHASRATSCPSCGRSCSTRARPCLCHQEIVPALVLPSEPLLEYEAAQRGVSAPHHGAREPVQPRHQRYAGIMRHRRPSPTTRSASAGAGRGDRPVRAGPHGGCAHYDDEGLLLRASFLTHPEGGRGVPASDAFEHLGRATRGASASPRARGPTRVQRTSSSSTLSTFVAMPGAVDDREDADVPRPRRAALGARAPRHGHRGWTRSKRACGTLSAGGAEPVGETVHGGDRQRPRRRHAVVVQPGTRGSGVSEEARRG